MFAIGIFALVLLMTGCRDRAVTPAQLPGTVMSFIQQNFPGKTVTYAEKDLELTGYKYEVTLADGTRIEFDTDDLWDNVQGTMSYPVPTALIPEAILAHLQSNYPDAMVLKIDKESFGYEMELANGLELKYNKGGALMEVDD